MTFWKHIILWRKWYFIWSNRIKIKVKKKIVLIINLLFFTISMNHFNDFNDIWRFDALHIWQLWVRYVVYPLFVSNPYFVLFSFTAKPILLDSRSNSASSRGMPNDVNAVSVSKKIDTQYQPIFLRTVTSDRLVWNVERNRRGGCSTSFCSDIVAKTEILYVISRGFIWSLSRWGIPWEVWLRN